MVVKMVVKKRRPDHRGCDPSPAPGSVAERLSGSENACRRRGVVLTAVTPADC